MVEKSEIKIFCRRSKRRASDSGDYAIMPRNQTAQRKINLGSGIGVDFSFWRLYHIIAETQELAS